MQGTWHIITEAGAIERRIWDHNPSLKERQEAVGGGLIQPVPHFEDYIPAPQQAAVKCFCWCNEEGKVHGMAVNQPATIMWHHALIRSMGVPLIDANGIAQDLLVGPVLIEFGDPAFMRAVTRGE